MRLLLSLVVLSGCGAIVDDPSFVGGSAGIATVDKELVLALPDDGAQQLFFLPIDAAPDAVVFGVDVVVSRGDDVLVGCGDSADAVSGEPVSAGGTFACNLFGRASVDGVFLGFRALGARSDAAVTLRATSSGTVTLGALEPR